MRCAHPEKFSSLDLGAARASWEILFKLVSQWPGLFHPARRFSTEPSRLSFLPPSLQTFPPFVPPYLLAFFFACMARGYTPFPSSSLSLFPSVDSSRPSLIPSGSLSLFLSIFLHLVPSPLKRAERSTRAKLRFIKKRSSSKLIFCVSITQKKKGERERNISLFWLYYTFSSTTRQPYSVFKFVRRFQSEQRMF